MLRKISLLITIFCMVATTSVFAQGSNEKEITKDKPLMIYSPQGESDITWIQKEAEKDLDFEIQILRLGGGELTDRVLAEKNNPQADVIFGLVPLAMNQLKNEDLLTPYIPSWNDDISAAFKDSQHYFHSFWQTPIVLAYNADILTSQQAPKSWLDLTKDQYKGKYTIGSTTGQTVRTYLSGMIWRFYDSKSKTVDPECWAFLKELYKNAKAYPDGDLYYQEVASGDMPIVLNWLGGVEKGAKQNDINISYVDTEGGTPIIAEAIALVNKKNINPNAKAFIDWFGSAEVQAKMAQDLGKAPASSIALGKAPKATKDLLSNFTAQEIDWSVVSDNIDSWLEKLELEIIN